MRLLGSLDHVEARAFDIGESSVGALWAINAPAAPIGRGSGPISMLDRLGDNSAPDTLTLRSSDFSAHAIMRDNWSSRSAWDSLGGISAFSGHSTNLHSGHTHHAHVSADVAAPRLSLKLEPFSGNDAFQSHGSNEVFALASQVVAAAENTLSPVQIDALEQGITQTFTQLQSNLIAQVFAETLPVIGNNLADAATGGAAQLQYLTTLKNALVAGLNSLDGATAHTEVEVEQAINSSLAAAGIGRGTGVNLDLSDPSDARLSFTTDRAYGAVSTPVEADLGLPNLGLKTSGSAQTSLTYNFKTTVGLDGSGFYLDTTPASTAFQVGASTRIPGFNAGADFSLVGLVSRFPIASTVAVFDQTKADSGSVMAYRLTCPDGREVTVCSAHLDYKHYALNWVRGYHGGEPDWKMIDENHDGAPDRQADAEAILKYNRESKRDVAINAFIAFAQSERAAGRPVILAGDFNEGSHLDWTDKAKNFAGHYGVVLPWDNSLALAKAGFRDAWRVVFLDEVTHPGFTWPATAFGKKTTSWTPLSDERDRIDFIYASDALRPVHAWIVGPRTCFVGERKSDDPGEDPFLCSDLPWPSDHKGVMVEFTY